jgi:hypothetical protein
MDQASSNSRTTDKVGLCSLLPTLLHVSANPSAFHDLPSAAGCVLFLPAPSTNNSDANGSDAVWNSSDKVTESLVRLFLDQQNAAEWEHLVDSWQAHPADSTSDVDDALRCYIQLRQKDPSRHSVGGDEDLLWWQAANTSGSKLPPVGNWTKLKRVLWPLSVVVPALSSADSANGGSASPLKSTVTSSRCVVAKESLADMLVQYTPLRDTVLEFLLRQVLLLERRTHLEKTARRNSLQSPETTIDVSDPSSSHNVLKTLLLRTFHRAGGKFVFRGKQVDLQRLRLQNLLALESPALKKKRGHPGSPSSTNTVPKLSVAAVAVVPEKLKSGNEHQSHNTTSSVDQSTRNSQLEQLDIENKRNELIKIFQSKETPAKVRRLNGTVLVTQDCDGMTEKQFLEETHFMGRVNATFCRQFFPGTSRPRLATVSLVPDQLQRLRNIFFSSTDGRLHRHIIPDVSNSPKHNYICFVNKSNAGSNDSRWQIPIKMHVRMPVPTRQAVETLCTETGLVHPIHENLRDIHILVGGTEDQSLHHDMAREFTSWLPTEDYESEQDATLGWEYNRLAYNDAMASRYSPSGQIISLGDRATVHIGVQKDQVELEGTSRCRVVNGREGETFRIVRESQDVVVLEADVGCAFTGDFPHAGVRNFESKTPEGKLMESLYEKIDYILELDLDQEDTTRMVLDVMCAFPGLHKICRLYISTHLSETRMKIPQNTIGWTDCVANDPSVSDVTTKIPLE